MTYLKSSGLLAAAIAIIVLAVLLATESEIGLTWDEPDYIVAAESYAAWFGALFREPSYALSRKGIETYWAVNHEHPPLDKIWSGMVWVLFRSHFDDLTAHRLGNMLMNSLSFGLLFVLVQHVYGLWAGLAASASLLTMPRFFFHSHLAALDAAAATVILATVFAFWTTRDRRSYWIDVALGILWGMAVATKINAVFVLPTLLLWALVFDRRPRMFGRFLVMGTVAVAVFFSSWPWLYYDTAERAGEYIRFITIDHWKIGQWYLNRFYMPPPWHFPFAITGVVVPVTTLLLFFVGIGRIAARSEERAFGGYLVLHALVPILMIAIGQSMVYDNDRLFVPAMPFIAALSAVGLWTIAQAIGRRLSRAGRQLLIGVVAVVVFTLPIVPAIRLYPHLLSFYSVVVGGVSGATRLGFETTYWCETYEKTLDYLNAHAKTNDVVWVDPWSHNVMIYYQLHGMLRNDLRFAGPMEIPSIFDQTIVTTVTSYHEADLVVFQHRQTTFGEQGLNHPMVSWLEAQTPVFEKRVDGVPLISVYRKSERK